MPDEPEPTSAQPASRQALARRYRPRRFSDIVMQDHVSATLKGAVARGRVGHGYLFAGPRGVGKTTAARVLAMALNCPDRSEDGEPCGTCESCERIWAGRTSLDVVEIDAATNRGVDDARGLRERAMYAPTDERRYKVYIIDEAHMLTREAWNALLKILEEPPPRVIFIFATTEPQRIQQAAPPVLSRCQRFDFRRITTGAIVSALRQVLANEGIEADDDALIPIARRADGGMRDALSLLDQVLALADRRLTGEDVRRVLGLVGQDLFVELFQILADRRAADVFGFVQRLTDDGYDLAEFHRGLADSLRELLIIKLDGTGAETTGEEGKNPFVELAARFDTGDLLRMLAQTAELDADGRFRKSSHPRVALELLLLKFAYLERTVALEDVVRALGSVAPAAEPAARVGSSRPALIQNAADVSAPPPTVAQTRQHAPPLAPKPSVRELAPAMQPAGSVAVSEDGPAGPDPTAEIAAGGEIETVFRSIIRAGEGIPPGLRSFLLAARVIEEPPGTVVVEVPPGPGWERLEAEPTMRAAIRRALVDRLGRDLSLELRPDSGARPDDAPPVRLTPARLRQERLQRLRAEPVLGRLIDEWGLELID